MSDSALPPLSVLAAWQRRGSAVQDALTEAASWDALAVSAVTPAQAGACIARADAIVLGNVEVLQAVLDEEDRTRPPVSIDTGGTPTAPLALAPRPQPLLGRRLRLTAGLKVR